MTFREFKKASVNTLLAQYGEKESAAMTDILLEWVTGKDKTELFAGYDRELGSGEAEKLEDALFQLLGNRPVQYITGRMWFYGQLFQVDERVLIPRPETEELVKWILDDWASQDGLRILDAGTGSGCIAVSLAKYLRNAEVTALDISAGALEVARQNARQAEVSINFIQADILDRDSWSRFSGFDILVSNPPYIRNSEKIQMRANVLDHEPPEALFVPDDRPLLFYEALAGYARGHLSRESRIYCEINEAHGQETLDLMLAKGYNEVILRKDLQGKDRMIRAGMKT